MMQQDVFLDSFRLGGVDEASPIELPLGACWNVLLKLLEGIVLM